MKWVELLIAVLSGLIVCIPLVAQLVENVRESIMEATITITQMINKSYNILAQIISLTKVKDLTWHITTHNTNH